MRLRSRAARGQLSAPSRTAPRCPPCCARTPPTRPAALPRPRPRPRKQRAPYLACIAQRTPPARVLICGASGGAPPNAVQRHGSSREPDLLDDTACRRHCRNVCVSASTSRWCVRSAGGSVALRYPGHPSPVPTCQRALAQRRLPFVGGTGVCGARAGTVGIALTKRSPCSRRRPSLAAAMPHLCRRSRVGISSGWPHCASSVGSVGNSPRRRAANRRWHEAAGFIPNPASAPLAWEPSAVIMRLRCAGRTAPRKRGRPGRSQPAHHRAEAAPRQSSMGQGLI